MWHPVGPLPAAVYWRRRLAVVTLVLVVVAGLSWLGVRLVSGRTGNDASEAAAASSSRPVPTPALERVVPSFGTLATPTPPPPPATAAPATGRTQAPAGAAGGSCTDDMLALAVRAPAAVAIGSKPTLQLVVQNRSRVPCVRALDKDLQEVVLLDARGTRRWGSNDCFPSSGPDSRTLAPGAAVSLPLVWSGLTSEPTCTAPRVAPLAGAYVLRGRLDTKISPDTAITLR